MERKIRGGRCLPVNEASVFRSISLRPPGFKSEFAVFASVDGGLNNRFASYGYSDCVSSENVAVLSAAWINLIECMRADIHPRALQVRIEQAELFSRRFGSAAGGTCGSFGLWAL